MITLSGDFFAKFNNQWALLTAGTPEDFNTMTISWGGMGTLWRRPVATVYVKPIRHTYSYMNREEYFTVSFYPEEQKKALGYLGSHSGRDEDKVATVGFTPVALEHGVTFAEAETTLVCRKLYCQDLEPAQMPADVVEMWYTTEEPHRMYIGEVLEVIQK